MVGLIDNLIGIERQLAATKLGAQIQVPDRYSASWVIRKQVVMSVGYMTYTNRACHGIICYWRALKG
jgi:hypothetical protein